MCVAGGGAGVCVWLVCVWGVYLPSQIPVSIGSLAGCRCLKSTLNKHLGWNLATCVYRQPLNLPKWGGGGEGGVEI